MPKQGRVGDKSKAPVDAHGGHCCPHTVEGPAKEGSPNVFVNGKSALRVGDPGVHSACCGPNTWQAAKGSKSVYINGKPAHRLDDLTTHCGGPGQLIEGSDNVFVGGTSISLEELEEQKKKELEDKKKRLAERKQLIEQGRAKANDPTNDLTDQERKELWEACDSLENDMKLVEDAKLTQSVFSDSGTPTGWKRVQDWDYPSGFHAALYESEMGDNRMVLAFRGSEKEWNDWQTNFLQGLGYQSAQYDEAVQTAQVVIDTYGPNVTVTGYSLGGGLAATAGTVLYLDGTTFNAAGVHQNTLRRYGLTRNDACGIINNYHIDDILTFVQENPVVRILLLPLRLLLSLPNILTGHFPFGSLPSAIGNSIKLPVPQGVNMLERHINPEHVINSLETEKENAQKIIKSSL